jgi:hypothetical protein
MADAMHSHMRVSSILVGDSPKMLEPVRGWTHYRSPLCSEDGLLHLRCHHPIHHRCYSRCDHNLGDWSAVSALYLQEHAQKLTESSYPSRAPDDGTGAG